MHFYRMKEASLTCDELEEHARKIAIEHSLSRKQSILIWPIPRLNDNYNFILSLYKDLNEDVRKKQQIPQAAEWLLDNFYIIEEQVKSLRRDLSKETYYKLPVLKCGLLKGYPRILAITMELLSHVDGQINEPVLMSYFKAYQTHTFLLDREIWAIPDAVKISLIENIRQICERIRETREQWNQANEMINALYLNEAPNLDKGLRALKNKLKSMEDTDYSLIEHILFRLRRGGENYVPVLKFMVKFLGKRGTTMEAITQKEHNSQAVNTVSIGNSIMSLKFISNLDWLELFEEFSHLEKILKEDPDGTYPLMEQASRNFYRSKVEEIALRFSVSEFHVAKVAVELAKNTYSGRHVGFYLLGKGIPELESALGSEPQILSTGLKTFKKLPLFFYFLSLGVITLILLLGLFLYSYYSSKEGSILLILAVVLLTLIPVSEIAVSLVHWVICKIKKPTVFPRLELKDGIPSELKTLVIIPALISDKKRVTELLQNLENHYLANKEKNLFFSLVGDFKDSDQEKEEADKEIVEEALKGIGELNKAYGKGEEIFFYFQRIRKFNSSHEKWMGWERKRGAIMEFNQLVLGATETSFHYMSSSELPFHGIKYIITLDADTILKMGMAKKLIGTMAHPLHQPMIQKEKGIVTEGYGLMQPRIAFEMESTNKSLFSRIFAGEEGLDPYACAISDVYQDYFGEGIFTGKGIYDVQVFQSVMKDKIPENSILSHDLLEGCFIRTALASDLELVDSYPSTYSSYVARLHRWIRGDWQLLPWLCRKVPTETTPKGRNPLSILSRWKICDNLRRSLVPIFNTFLLLFAWILLPGSPIFWFLLAVLTIGFPFILSLLDFLSNKKNPAYRLKRHIPVFSGLKAAFIQVFLLIVFLPFQGFISAHAITSSLVRVYFTRKKMLSWVTAADSERSQKNTLRFYYKKMSGSLLIPLLFLFFIIFLRIEAVALATILTMLWLLSPYIAYKLSIPSKVKEYKFQPSDITELKKIARKTFRYFEEFTNLKNNYLAPDNYQEDPPRGIAHRTSPTNIGIGLLAFLSARDFGFIGTTEMVESIEKTVSTMEKMEKWKGHLYNWYDTRTLKPLKPAYVSTVDSGNLLCYLITLLQGLREYENKSFFDLSLISGIQTTLELFLEEAAFEDVKKIREEFHSLDPWEDLSTWTQKIKEILLRPKVLHVKMIPWKQKLEHQLENLHFEIQLFMPWISFLERDFKDSSYFILDDKIHDALNKIIKILRRHPPLSESVLQWNEALEELAVIKHSLEKENKIEYRSLVENLEKLEKSVLHGVTATETFLERLKLLKDRINDLAVAIEFKPLYVEKKQLFSIGYNLEENRLTNSYYDLLASEARQTSFISIARGEVPVAHWFKMGRALTVVDHYKGLVSWTGTMFEYLMPLLIMKSYKNTLLDETYSFVLRSQKKYGRQRDIPWGTSESGFNSLDLHLDYQYKAIGVPWLGLKRGLIEDAVCAPYATFLGLMVDRESALENIRYLKREGAEGSYGFYEAVDYTPERIPLEERKVVVKSYMAHHQGMSLLALNNILNGMILQERFHREPMIKSAKLLLQEKVPMDLVLTKEEKERVSPFKDLVYKEKGPIRKYFEIDSRIPKVHILSNGNYSVMITDRGTGFSKNNNLQITRWREDVTLDSYGLFFYIKNIEKNTLWSNTFSPLNIMPSSHEVVFTSDKASFIRQDNEMETKTEVIVASGDNVEIRTLTIKNNGLVPAILEITSLLEIVLSSHASDVAHPAFNNLFIQTEYHPEKNVL